MAPHNVAPKRSQYLSTPSPLEMVPSLYLPAVFGLNAIGEASVYTEASRQFDRVWQRTLSQAQTNLWRKPWKALPLESKRRFVREVLADLSKEFNTPLHYAGDIPFKERNVFSRGADIHPLTGNIRITDFCFANITEEELEILIKHEVGHRLQVVYSFGPAQTLPVERINSLFEEEGGGRWRFFSESKRIEKLRKIAGRILREMGYAKEWVEKGTASFQERGNLWLTTLAMEPDVEAVKRKICFGFEFIHQPFRQATIDLSRADIKTQRAWALIGRGRWGSGYGSEFTERDANHFAVWNNEKKPLPPWLVKTAGSEQTKRILAGAVYAIPLGFTLFDGYQAWQLHQSDAPFLAVGLQDAKVAGDIGLALAGYKMPRAFANWGMERLSQAFNDIVYTWTPIRTLPDMASIGETPLSLLRTFAGGLGIGVASLGAGVDIVLTTNDPETNNTERALSYGNGVFTFVSSVAVFFVGKLFLPALALSGGIAWARHDVTQSRETEQLYQAFVTNNSEEYKRCLARADSAVVSRFIDRLVDQNPEYLNKLNLSDMEQLQTILADSVWRNPSHQLFLEMLKPTQDEEKVERLMADCGPFVLAEVYFKLSRLHPALADNYWEWWKMHFPFT